MEETNVNFLFSQENPTTAQSQMTIRRTRLTRTEFLSSPDSGSKKLFLGAAGWVRTVMHPVCPLEMPPPPPGPGGEEGRAGLWWFWEKSCRQRGQVPTDNQVATLTWEPTREERRSAPDFALTGCTAALVPVWALRNPSRLRIHAALFGERRTAHLRKLPVSSVPVESPLAPKARPLLTSGRRARPPHADPHLRAAPRSGPRFDVAPSRRTCAGFVCTSERLCGPTHRF